MERPPRAGPMPRHLSAPKGPALSAVTAAPGACARSPFPTCPKVSATASAPAIAKDDRPIEESPSKRNVRVPAIINPELASRVNCEAQNMECSHLLAADLPASEQLLFESGTACIGAVRCPPDRPEFRDCGPARSFCFVFPRSAVIVRRGDELLTEDPTIVSFYNQTDEYERRE